MAKWGVTANKGAANVQGVMYVLAAAASPRRAKLYDYSLGCGASPADAAFVHVIQRATATSLASSAKTPNALDPADSLASTIQVSDTVTTDGTLTASAFLSRKALNQRSTFRWVAAPGGEILVPATTNAGVMMGLSAVSTTSFDYDLHYEEL